MIDSLERLRTALAQRYAVEGELGRGGMATVYRARDLKHDRPVTHPHILPLHDSGDADGTLYYVMPYIEGESLRDRLRRERQLGVDEAIRSLFVGGFCPVGGC